MIGIFAEAFSRRFPKEAAEFQNYPSASEEEENVAADVAEGEILKLEGSNHRKYMNWKEVLKREFDISHSHVDFLNTSWINLRNGV